MQTGDFDWSNLKRGLVPAVTGIAVSTFASRTGMNRNLSKIIPVKL